MPLNAYSVEPTKPSTRIDFSVELADNDEVHINPCEPLYLLFDVSAKGDPNLEDIRTQIIKDVAVDDRQFFERGAPSRIMSVDVIRHDESLIGFVFLFWNGSFAFEQPGIHRVRLHPDLEVTVIVDEPNHRDAEVLTLLMQIKDSYRLLVMNPMTRHDEKSLETMAGIIKDYPGSTYTPWLGLGLGTIKLLTLSKTSTKDDEAYHLERVRIARKYFEPYCLGDIQSPIHAAGALQLALEIAHAEKLISRNGGAIDLTKLASARRALQAVADSRPFSLAHAHEAQMSLGDLDALERSENKTP
ncbi:MAG: hypothetical protein AABZ47_14900 [Planctomycetota bacterium]